MASQHEIRESVTGRIIEALRSGQVPPWRRPWAGDNAGTPRNAVSRKSYRGVNVLLLGCQPYRSRYWATYRQWLELKCQVRRGQHGTKIVFWRPVERQVVNDQGDAEAEEFLLLREYTVFNAEQVEGMAVEHYFVSAVPKPFVDFAPAEEVIAATGADIRFGGLQAFYRPDQDFIGMPSRHSFVSEKEFYSTAFHELAHWTGHVSRLDRLPKNARFGDAAYAFEELVAEVAGCFLLSELDLPQGEDLTNHNAYLGHWLAVLEQDAGAILRAAGQASKAVDFILAFSRKREGAESEEAEAVGA
jgi:antirestriction protein ArdC